MPRTACRRAAGRRNLRGQSYNFRFRGLSTHRSRLKLPLAEMGILLRSSTCCAMAPMKECHEQASIPHFILPLRAGHGRFAGGRRHFQRRIAVAIDVLRSTHADTLLAATAPTLLSCSNNLEPAPLSFCTRAAAPAAARPTATGAISSLRGLVHGRHGPGGGRAAWHSHGPGRAPHRHPGRGAPEAPAGCPAAGHPPLPRRDRVVFLQRWGAGERSAAYVRSTTAASTRQRERSSVGVGRLRESPRAPSSASRRPSRPPPTRPAAAACTQAGASTPCARGTGTRQAAIKNPRKQGRAR